MGGAEDRQGGALRLDLAGERLWRGAEALRLRPKSFAVLRYLVAQSGRVVTKEELLQAVWPDTVIGDAALMVCINELRTVLGDAAQAPQYIETVHRRGYRWIGTLRTADGPAATPPPPLPASLPPLVIGREAELRRLQTWFAAAQSGRRQVGFITGESGSGKTALVDAFCAWAATQGEPWLAQGACLDHYGAGEAYLPVLEALGQLGRGPDGERLVAWLARQAPTWLVHMPALCSAVAFDALQHRVQGATRERMLREFAEALEVLTADRPLILVLEDLHWSDYATLDLITWLAQRQEPARLCVLGTYRPVEVIVRGHPLRAVTQELVLHQRCEELALGSLSEPEVAQYLAVRFAGSHVPSELARAIYQRTDGNPLFMVTVVDALVHQEAVRMVEGRWHLTAGVTEVVGGVPESLRQMIEQQLAQCSADEQGVLEAASVAGRAFSAAIAAVGVAGDIEAAEACCARLAWRGQFLEASGVEEWPDGTVAERYQFRHALYQQVVYERVPVGRRMRLHLQIGARLEAGYRAQAQERAAELAQHFLAGRDTQQAVSYLQQAAVNALRRSAYQEAISHCTRGLEVLTGLPETPERVQQELTFQLTLGPVLTAMQGFGAPEAAQVYNRAHELCQQVGDPSQLFPALFGLWRFYNVRAELHTARALGQQLLSRAQSTQDPTHLVVAHYALGVTLFFQGEFTAALGHFEHRLPCRAPQQHALAIHYGLAPGVGCLAYAAWTLWWLGYPDQALQRSQEALALAHEVSHPHTLAFARLWATALHQLRQEVSATREQAEAVRTLSIAQGFPHWLAHGTIHWGWVLAQQGQRAEGLTEVRQGLTAFQTTGARLLQSYWLALLAETCAQAQQTEDGLAAVAEALAVVDETGERFYAAELHRLRAEILLKQTTREASEVEAHLHQALALARCQQARSLELRAAMSLSRLWQRQGKSAAARALLAEVYGWFTEGFDTADLQAARALLEAYEPVARGH